MRKAHIPPPRSLDDLGVQTGRSNIRLNRPSGMKRIRANRIGNSTHASRMNSAKGRNSMARANDIQTAYTLARTRVCAREASKGLLIR